MDYRSSWRARFIVIFPRPNGLTRTRAPVFGAAVYFDGLHKRRGVYMQKIIPVTVFELVPCTCMSIGRYVIILDEKKRPQ